MITEFLRANVDSLTYDYLRLNGFVYMPRCYQICLIIPGVPWAFGPYQHQGYLLSLELHKQGYKV
jgi:hypothetical protein